MILPLLKKFKKIFNSTSQSRIYVKYYSDEYNSRKKYAQAITCDLLCIALIILFGFFTSKQTSPTSFVVASPLIQLLQQKKPAPQDIVLLPNGETTPLPNLTGLTTKNMKYKNTITSQAHSFMNLPPSSKTRMKRELELMQFLTDQNASAADILLASEAVVTKPARAWVMEELWQQRQQGKLSEFYIYPLSEEKIAWAKTRNIDPRILAIATDLYGPVLKVVEARKNLFFEAALHTKAKDTTTSKYIPSPAVIARLQMTETGWNSKSITNQLEQFDMKWNYPISKEDRAFVNIGTVNAWDALNLDESWFPSGQDDLLWIAKQLESSNGLPYTSNVEKIPGSIRGSGDGSGGAIGPQLMPINARLFMTWYQDANHSMDNKLPPPNPFNPWTGTMLSYLYLVSEFYHRQTNIDNVTSVIRPGYAILEKQTDTIAYDKKKDPRIRALLKWNPLYWQAKAAVKAGEEFNSLWYSQETIAHK